MNIKNDYSMLFNGLNNSKSTNGSSNIFQAIDLSEYSSIKKGTYGKLLKAYYAKEDTDKTTSSEKTTSKKRKLSKETSVDKLTDVSANASSVKTSAEKLITKGNASLFKEKELTVKNADGTETKQMGYDTDAIYKAVRDLADQYNKFVGSVDDSDSSKLDLEFDNMSSIFTDYCVRLEKAGVTINKDHTLSVDEKTLKETDISDLKQLFNGNASFAYKLSAKVSMIGVTADREANTMKNYTSSGKYSQTYSSGSLMNDLF